MEVGVISRLILFLACSWCALPVFSQDGTPEDKRQLQALLETVRNAVNTRDLAVLYECFSDSFSATMIDQKIVTTRKGLEDYYREVFTGDKAIVKSLVIAPEADALTRIHEGTFGTVYGRNVEKYELTNGKKVTLHSRWTAAVIKTDGKWKITAIHNGVDFVDNPILSETRKSRWYFLALGLFAGLAAGILIPWSPY
jgi:hypothetical protein